MDCGQGYCACQNGQCTAVIFAELLNADGPVATKLSSDPAVTSPELAAPANLSALGSQGQIDISWEDNSQGETGFEVHRSPTGAPNSFILLETVGANGTAFSNLGLTIGEHFCYQVRAVRERTNTTTYSDFSNIACTTAAPVAIVSFEAVFTGGAHTCALTSVGEAYCWGRGESGQLGVSPPPSTCLTDGGVFSCSMVPVPVGGGLTFEKLAGGAAHTCGLTSDGTAYCWGNNASGQLGDNSTTSRNAPVPVATGLKFVSIDAGAAHTCAVTSAGEAYCWGRNNRGQLGNGTTTPFSAVPVAVTGSLTFQLIAAGGFSIGHTCGLTDLGAAYCWGDNDRGQLGIGTSDLNPHALPEPVSGGLVFAGLTAGLGRHSCGLTDLGAAYCWGANTFGALGDRSRRDSAVPVAVVGNLSFDQLIAGGFIGHTCGVIDGAAYCWGENEKGQVGDGTTIDRRAPEAVAGGLAFLSIDAGFRHTCGRASTGTVYCWGSSGAGQLGNNSNSLSTVPAKVFGQP
jgi:alpha-tubulin suppressor-like RCC1 family protein